MRTYFRRARRRAASSRVFRPHHRAAPARDELLERPMSGQEVGRGGSGVEGRSCSLGFRRHGSPSLWLLQKVSQRWARPRVGPFVQVSLELLGSEVACGGWRLSAQSAICNSSPSAHAQRDSSKAWTANGRSAPRRSSATRRLFLAAIHRRRSRSYVGVGVDTQSRERAARAGSDVADLLGQLVLLASALVTARMPMLISELAHRRRPSCVRP